VIPIHTFLDLARTRRSIRRYKPDHVPEELLREVVEAARWAPSAVNLQPWEFIIVTDPEVKAQVGRNARYFGLRWPHIHEAPALIVVCARKVSKFSRDDCIFAGANIMLAATDRGLGTCWIGGFDERVIRGILAVPEDYILPGFCTIGYPEGETEAPPKRPLDEMLHRNTFQGRRGGLRKLRGPLEVLGRILRLQGRRGQMTEDRWQSHDISE
jgi:nitroreductase